MIKPDSELMRRLEEFKRTITGAAGPAAATPQQKALLEFVTEIKTGLQDLLSEG